MSARKAKFYPVSQGVQLGEYSVHCLADLRAIGSRLIVIEGDPGSGKTTLLRQLIKVLRVPQCSDVVTRVTPNVLGGCALKGLPVLCIDDLLSSLSDISSVALEQFTVARVWSYRPLRMPSVFTSRVDTIVIATALPGWQWRCRGLARRARVFNLGKGVGE